MDFGIQRITDYTLIKILVERLEISNAPIFKSELVAVNTTSLVEAKLILMEKGKQIN